MAGTVGAPINRLGMAGVAPDVELVNIRAGQDSGYFFLQPSVDALTYAADVGVDVVNMSYYIDPWLYNCADNPADSPEEQLEQQTVIRATERALAYARARGVTLVSAEGNGNTDLGKPVVDATSPDYPPDTERTRARSTTRASRSRWRRRACSASPRSARASARRTTRTTASSRPTCRHPAVTSARASALRTTATPPTRCWRRTRSRWRSPTARSTRTARPTRRSCWPTARAATARTTSTSRARRWRRRTRSASRPWWWRRAGGTTGCTAV